MKKLIKFFVYVLIVSIIALSIACDNSKTVQEDSKKDSVAIPFKASDGFKVDPTEFVATFNEISDVKIEDLRKYAFDEHGWVYIDGTDDYFPLFYLHSEFYNLTDEEFEEELEELMVEGFVTEAKANSDIFLRFFNYEEFEPSAKHIDHISIIFPQKNMDENRQFVLDLVKAMYGTGDAESSNVVNELYKIKDYPVQDEIMQYPGMKDGGEKVKTTDTLSVNSGNIGYGIKYIYDDVVIGIATGPLSNVRNFYDWDRK